MKYWKKELDTPNSTIWRNKTDPSLTFEVHTLSDDYFMENYYAFPARNGKGITDSPELFFEKNDAIEWAKDWMKDKKPGWQKNYWGV